jgi:LVIVD repeat
MVILFAGCTPTMEEPIPSPATAYVPVYFQQADIYAAKFESARPIVKAGKQYVLGNLLLQNEVNEGIHLIDVSNPATPRKLGFISIPLCTDMAMRQGYLYCNNYDDLVVVDLRVPAEPKLVKRVKDVFPPANQDYPPFFNVSFQCPDKRKGIVVGWELKDNVSALCRR